MLNGFDMPTNVCPQNWSVERCQRRQKELHEHLIIQEETRQEMITRAQERAGRNVYRRRQAERTQKELETDFQNIQETLRRRIFPEYAPWENFTHNSFADLSIVGFPKAGTSQLYKLFVSHQDAGPIFKRKEFCIDHNHFLDYTLPQHLDNNETMMDLQKKLFRYHRHLLKRRTERHDNDSAPSGSQKPSLLVNACLQTEELDYHVAYAPMPTDAKFVVLFRDPADWLWASWNFWIDKQLDDRRPVDHDWATVGYHYRSPELFHELILSQEGAKTAAHRFRAMREKTVEVPRRLQFLIDKKNLLFLKSESMKASNGGLTNFLEQVSDFTGLSISGFNMTVANGRTNCNMQKGFQNLCDGREKPSASTSGYEITHFRPMLEETRQFIYMQFWEECKVWAEEFGIVYEECLGAVPRSK